VIRSNGRVQAQTKGVFPDCHSWARVDPQRQLAAEGAALFRPTLAASAGSHAGSNRFSNYPRTWSTTVASLFAPRRSQCRQEEERRLTEKDSNLFAVRSQGALGPLQGQSWRLPLLPAEKVLREGAVLGRVVDYQHWQPSEIVLAGLGPVIHEIPPFPAFFRNSPALRRGGILTRAANRFGRLFALRKNRLIRIRQLRLPEVATRLRELAAELNCSELSDLADEISRRPSGQRAARTSVPMTDSLRERIRTMKAAEPHLSKAEIGKRLNVNPGRVSEALKGKRT
jgi:hypothetical protein